MTKDKIGGIAYVCQIRKKVHSEHPVLPLFMGERCAAAGNLRYRLSDPIPEIIQKYGK